MRPLFDDFDEFEFAVNPVRKSMRRDQRRQAHRFAKRSNPWRRAGDYVNRDDDDDFNDYDQYTEYDFGH